MVGAAMSLAVSGCVFGETVTRFKPTALIVTTTTVAEDPYLNIYAKKGSPYSKVVKWSHYNAAIVNNGQLRGNSRIWGDATQATQRASIEAIRAGAKLAGMNAEQEAMVLAIAYVESGFKPGRSCRYDQCTRPGSVYSQDW